MNYGEWKFAETKISQKYNSIIIFGAAGEKAEAQQAMGAEISALGPEPLAPHLDPENAARLAETERIRDAEEKRVRDAVSARRREGIARPARPTTCWECGGDMGGRNVCPRCGEEIH